jgi:hypothetical protein
MELPVKIIIPDELLVAGPRGEPGRDGVTPSLTIGTVETLAAGRSAFVTMSGVAPNYVLNFGIPTAAPATAPQPEPGRDPRPPTQWKVVWAKDNQPLAAAFASLRVTYDSAMDALRFRSTAGTPNAIAQYSWYPHGTGTSLKATHARASCELFMQPGFEVKPSQSGKTALGLWIGVKHQPKAGAHPDDQVMASVRAYRPATSAGQIEPRASLYSYHLNRRQNDAGDPAKWYGVGPRVKTPGGADLVVPAGRWLRLLLEVKLNTITDGRGNPDGWASYEIYDGADLLGRALLEGAIWRHDPAWLIAGPSFTDMWGGGTGQTPPKSQDLWHRNYKIEVPQ